MSGVEFGSCHTKSVVHFVHNSLPWKRDKTSLLSPESSFQLKQYSTVLRDTTKYNAPNKRKKLNGHPRLYWKIRKNRENILLCRSNPAFSLDGSIETRTKKRSHTSTHKTHAEATATTQLTPFSTIPSCLLLFVCLIDHCYNSRH